MSVPTSNPYGNAGRPAPASRRGGQLAAGLFITVAVIAALSLLASVPLGFARPVIAFVGAYPLLDAAVKAFVIVNFIALHVLLLIWWERKFAGWMQARLGPMHVGWEGLGQTAADAVKLLTKEDIIPASADRFLFLLAPYLIFVPTVMTFLVLPFSAGWVGADYDLAALYVIAVSTVTALGVMAAGWGANNKYSLMGGVRAVAQLLSYEIPMVVSVLAVVALAGTMSLTGIVREQAEHGWLIWRYAPVTVPAFIIFIICALAEVNRTPFDLPEADSELVSGFNTEYSGMRFAFFFLAEFANNTFSAGLAAVLFFGGWRGPLLPPVVWFLLKVTAIITLMMWIRWTVPRMRMDQMMGFCWKMLVPLSILVFCGAVLWPR